MSYDLVPGMRVVCVNSEDHRRYGDEIMPEVGVVYTIRMAGLDEIDGNSLLRLREIINEERLYWCAALGRHVFLEPCFDAEWFRPLDERRLDVFREALKKAPDPKVREEA
ncbi:hypothetical protein [Nitratireductor sp. GCM10026969]|uniref:hypothetical protein n=1 Tax=Nitratireductor sp. GCM10026969 TaxID=3252645 RepID=UPI0036208A57